MGRKRKLHLGNKPIGGAPVKSRRLAREITSQYHVIQNEKSLVAKEATLSAKERQQRMTELDEQMNKIGGTNAYQQASIISTQHFKTSKWVAGTLNKLGKQPISKTSSDGSNVKLNVLEVGAINTQLQQYNWMNVRSIDLNSQHPSIEECDFFTVEPLRQYDVVVCSMVLNCVDEPKRRGEMLLRLTGQLVPESGILFLVLPTRCINSKHVGGINTFSGLLRGVGLRQLLPVRNTPKLTFFILGNGSAAKAPAVATETVGVVVPDDSAEKTSSKDTAKLTVVLKNTKNTKTGSKAAPTAAAQWVENVQKSIAEHMKGSIFRHFTKDYSEAQPNEFALALPDVVVHGLSLKE